MMINPDFGISAVMIFLSSFLITFFVTPVLIRKMFARGLVGQDMNKQGKPKVAELGGIPIILGVSLAISTSIFILTYIGYLVFDLPILLAGTLTILLVGFIGIVDDLVGWKKGIRQWQHTFFPLFAALPLMAVQAGTDYVVLPFVGGVSIGIFYSLLLVPVGITGAANAFNMLAGFNGLEAGLGIIIVSTLTLIAFFTGSTEAVIIGIALIGALLAFLYYNKFPAKVFGGDSLTLMVGAGIATISILGNMEKIGVTIIALHWIELVFKARKKFQSECFGIPDKNGVLHAPKELGSLTHLILRYKPMPEKQLVGTILLAQTIVAATVFFLFWFKLFYF